MTVFNRSMIAGERLPFLADVSRRVISEWQPSALFHAGDVMRPTDANQTGFNYQNGAEGESGPIEPIWNVGAGSNTCDGSLNWTAIIPPPAGGDTIQSVSWAQLSPPDGALSISASTVTDLTAAAYFLGGTAGLKYTINGSILMVSGAIHIAQIILAVL